MNRSDRWGLFLQGLKSDTLYADEVINIVLLRPLASLLVRLIGRTSITPNQVTILSVIIGVTAGAVYLAGTPVATAIGGTMVLLKDITDDADGQLARAKSLYSRRGRFLDSIGDAVVSVAVFGGITAVLWRGNPSLWTVLLGAVSLVGMTLRVSYHVYYQASFLHTENRYVLNRTIETVTEEDLRGDPFTLRLQRIFILIYGWQDRMMNRIDRWSLRPDPDLAMLPVWYGDRLSLILSGLLGFGTELSLLAVCSWFDALFTYCVINCLVMNGIWLLNICYRRYMLSLNIPRHPPEI
ncbi:MAG TPA: CDP-alcohol phosphatidyltransferase family protein [Bacteroidota bacterium]|nr:CDP-alcohol phosphatidyltransferase family protein [Bacteroidota bacterium]